MIYCQVYKEREVILMPKKPAPKKPTVAKVTKTIKMVEKPMKIPVGKPAMAKPIKNFNKLK